MDRQSSKCRQNISIPPRQSGRGKKKLSAVTMVSFTFSLWNFTLSSDDCFVSGKNRLNCPERVVFEEIDPVWVIISGQLWKYGDRYRCFMS